MTNAEELPEFAYRDDGMLIWEAIKSYVTDVISIYYSGELKVKVQILYYPRNWK